jgi:hypothetical protein
MSSKSGFRAFSLGRLLAGLLLFIPLSSRVFALIDCHNDSPCYPSDIPNGYDEIGGYCLDRNSIDAFEARQDPSKECSFFISFEVYYETPGAECTRQTGSLIPYTPVEGVEVYLAY